MGGIICRYYVQELDGFTRVNPFVSISAPHHGSYLAWIYPGRGTRQMRPGSDFLKRLHEKEDAFRIIESYSCRTPFDLSILPGSSSIWNIAVNRKYYVLLRPLMVFNRRVMKDTLDIFTKTG
jgi:triacylglycerol lipase